MNLTVILRYIRVLMLPAFMLGIAAFFAMLGRGLEDNAAAQPVIETLISPVAWVFGVVGIVWLLWCLFQLFRWESGDTDGDCMNCGGDMSQLDGPYGPYRKCKYCGKKRQGW